MQKCLLTYGTKVRILTPEELLAARLPANDANSSMEGAGEERSGGGAVGVKRHSRKTARPRTAGRERMADQDREELLAMTDPSSSDAGEYEVC